jgi:hypothetical protein
LFFGYLRFPLSLKLARNKAMNAGPLVGGLVFVPAS